MRSIIDKCTSYTCVFGGGGRVTYEGHYITRMISGVLRGCVYVLFSIKLTTDFSNRWCVEEGSIQSVSERTWMCFFLFWHVGIFIADSVVQRWATSLTK